LADEPATLPWGASYDIELSGVDHEGVFVSARGGSVLDTSSGRIMGRRLQCTRETPLRF
jgi:hypothetical protein